MKYRQWWLLLCVSSPSESKFDLQILSFSSTVARRLGQ